MTPQNFAGPSLESIVGSEFREKMNREDNRVGSFKCPWTGIIAFPKVLGVSIHSMACHGFYYTGIGDKIRCNFCNVELLEFEPYDDVATEHMKYSPSCPLIRSPRTSGNISTFSRDTLFRDLKRAQTGVYQIARDRISRDVRTQAENSALSQQYFGHDLPRRLMQRESRMRDAYFEMHANTSNIIRYAENRRRRYLSENSPFFDDSDDTDDSDVEVIDERNGEGEPVEVSNLSRDEVGSVTNSLIDRGIYTEPLLADEFSTTTNMPAPQPFMHDQSSISSSTSTLSMVPDDNDDENHEMRDEASGGLSPAATITATSSSSVMADDENRLMARRNTVMASINEYLASSDVTPPRRRPPYSRDVVAAPQRIRINITNGNDCRKRLLEVLKKSEDEKIKRKDNTNAGEENFLRQCVVCYENDYDIVIMPCRHLSACNSCAVKLDKCPTCRGPMKRFIKVFPA